MNKVCVPFTVTSMFMSCIQVGMFNVRTRAIGIDNQGSELFRNQIGMITRFQTLKASCSHFFGVRGMGPINNFDRDIHKSKVSGLINPT